MAQLMYSSVEGVMTADTSANWLSYSYLAHAAPVLAGQQSCEVRAAVLVALAAELFMERPTDMASEVGYVCNVVEGTLPIELRRLRQFNSIIMVPQ